MDDSTICAIATPPGHGAISILRLSGKDAWKIAEKLVCFKSSEKNFAEQSANTVHYANIMDGPEVVDDVLVTLFRTPLSYTGEDLVEISCHGAVYIQQRILDALYGR